MAPEKFKIFMTTTLTCFMH